MSHGLNAARLGRIAKLEGKQTGKHRELSAKEAIARDIALADGETVIYLDGERISIWLEDLLDEPDYTSEFYKTGNFEMRDHDVAA
ncbi:MAG: hypothetical protein LBR70_04030 [Lactobacillaceae bacterium]|jgi:hypothetical protein|nr:hypothetical protein [Lactobacillaceae bacterium]